MIVPHAQPDGPSGLLLVDKPEAMTSHDVVDAVPVGELESVIDKYDVILLGPQIRFKEKDVKKLAEPKGIPSGVIDMRAYGMMDGKAAMDQARKLVAGK